MSLSSDIKNESLHSSGEDGELSDSELSQFADPPMTPEWLGSQILKLLRKTNMNAKKLRQLIEEVNNETYMNMK